MDGGVAAQEHADLQALGAHNRYEFRDALLLIDAPGQIANAATEPDSAESVVWA
jgi:hypothetical protein